MNRSLVISAGCSLLAFATLVSVFHGTLDRATFAESTQSCAPWRRGDHGTLPFTPDWSASHNAREDDDALLSIEDAEQSLTALLNEYLRPWRQWETSPHRLYSRAAPRPIPTRYASIAMSPGTLAQSDNFLVASIAVGTEAHQQLVPCVVDRINKRVGFFVEGNWLTEDEWLKSAPLPHSSKRR